ncbi:hypothetical protein VKT23_001633 [Stygiomarasmius scandens]|uniref:RTA1-like protein n=1 Tax=Marasmiellus scandens TaxID=2682957 RepID=A0ABR1K377_9AGAR
MQKMTKFVLFLLFSLASAQNTTDTGSAPTQAQHTAVEVFFGYTPSVLAAMFAGAVYLLSGIVLLYQVCKERDWWGICLPIGAFAMSLGFGVRILLHSKDHQSKTVLIPEEVLVSCSPAAYLAFNYIVYGRLLRFNIGSRHSLIRPNWIAAFFVTSDISTFVIQAGGAALLVSADTADRGEKVFQIGVTLQSVSYYLFCVLLIWTWWSIRKERIATGRECWWMAYKLLGISSAFIVIRTAYRILESFSGRGSTIRSHELFLYALDVTPLFIAIAFYIFWWPGKYMDGDSITDGLPNYQKVKQNETIYNVIPLAPSRGYHAY